MKPGIYRDIPASEYHALKFASASRLKVLKDSCPAQLKFQLDNPQEPTRAMVMGHATHSLALENTKAVAVADKCCAKLGGGQGRCKSNGRFLDRGQWYCLTHWKQFRDGPGDEVGLDVLTEGEYDTVLGMAASIRANPDTRKYLDHREDTELSLVWQCPVTGVTVKSRIDLLSRIDGRLVVADLKTTQDATEDSFAREIDNRGYDVQAAVYIRAIAATMGEYDVGFAFLTVEKAPPYLCTAYELDEESLLIGDDKATRLLNVWGECQRTKVWPGLPAKRIGLTKWAIRKAEQQ